MVKPQAAELAMRRLQNKPIARKQQCGVVLILVAFLMALAFSLFALKSLNSQDLTVLKQQKNAQALKTAKDAVIAWAVAHPNHPGQMPMPDRNTDGNYDGLADCNSPTSTFNYEFLIGQLPVAGQQKPCEQPQDLALASGLLDAEGNPLWYAVSRNLVHKYEITAPCIAGYTCQANQTGDPVINPITANAPPYPWMRVLDRNSNLVSDRVAAVIIAPGLPLSNQNRTGVAPAAIAFLDSFSIGGTVFSNADYDTANEDFVMGQNSRNVNASDNTVAQPYLFNDQLVYITIDELMPMLTKRAAAETSRLLRSYRASMGQFPFAANLGQALHNHYGNAPNQSGMLPVDVTDTCTCASASSCSCSFGLVQSIELRRGGSSTWNSAQDTGSCSSAVTSGRQICRCGGAGSCTQSTRRFECDALGNCTSLNLTGVNRWTFTTRQHLDIFTTPIGARCLPVWPVTSNSQPPCGDFSMWTDVDTNPLVVTYVKPFTNTSPPTLESQIFPVDITIGMREAYWFKENVWQDFFYYRWSAIPTMQAGGRLGLSALLIGAGAPLVSELGTNQTRPSGLIEDYLDSAENTDFDLVFDGLNKPFSNTYNDIPFIVAP